ncbi:MAG: hypothetical protein WC451_04570 [Patescibacteria group bacterium]|jgi:antitoxin component of MazEF toxin-antitoxin module
MERDPSCPARAEAENRKLIKFSNYSLCVTLPKWVIKELKWGKGDVVKMLVDSKKGEILIKKGVAVNHKNFKSTDTKKSATKDGKARW